MAIYSKSEYLKSIEKIKIFNNKLGIKTYFFNEDNEVLGYSEKDCVYINTYYDYDLWLINKHELLHKFVNSKEFNVVKEYIKESNINLEYLYEEYKLRYFNLYDDEVNIEEDIENEMIIDIISKNIETFPSIDEIVENAFMHIVSNGKVNLNLERRYLNLNMSINKIKQFSDYSKWDKIFINNYYAGKEELLLDKKDREGMIKKDINNALNRLLKLKDNKKYFRINPYSEEVIREYENEIKLLKENGEDVDFLDYDKEDVCSDIANERSNFLYRSYGYIARLVENSKYENSFKYLMLNEALKKIYKRVSVNNAIKKTVTDRIKHNSLSEYMIFNDFILDYIYHNTTLNTKFSSTYFSSLTAYNKSINNKNEIEIKGVDTYNMGRWLLFKGERSDYDSLHDNAVELSSLVKDTPWCTAELSYAQLSEGDFYVFVDNEDMPHVAIKMFGDDVEEVRGILNGMRQELEPAYRDIVLSFLKHNKKIRNGNGWYEKFEWNNRLLKYINNEIEDINLMKDDLFRKSNKYEENANVNKAIIAILKNKDFMNNHKEEYEDFCFKLMRKDGMYLQYIDDEFKNERICKEAILNNGESLKFVPYPLNTRKLSILGVIRSSKAIEFVPSEYLDEDFFVSCIAKNRLIILFTPSNIQTKSFYYKCVMKGLPIDIVPKDKYSEKLVAYINNNKSKR